MSAVSMGPWPLLSSARRAAWSRALTSASPVANSAAATESPQAVFEAARGPTAHTLANALIKPTPDHGQENDVDLPLLPFSMAAREGNASPAAQSKITAPGYIFDVPIRRDIVHYVVRWQLANRRSSVNAHTKTQGTVNGTTRKPHAQKGTGRARQGSRRGPHFRGGGVAFGPTNEKVHEIGCNRRTRRQGLMIALSAKAAEGRLLVVDGFHAASDADGDAGKTKNALKNIADLIGEPGETNPSCLFVYGSSGAAINDFDDADEDEDDNEQEEEEEVEGGAIADADVFDEVEDDFEGVQKLKRATSNLMSVDTIDQIGLNVYSILRRKHLVMSKAALSDLIERLSIPLKPRERYVMAVRSGMLHRASDAQ